MQVQSNLGPAGKGTAGSGSSTSPPDVSLPSPSPPPSPAPSGAANAAAQPDAAQVVAQEQVAKQVAEAQPGNRAVAPRARLNYDEETSEVFIEVLNPSNGDVLFTFPAKESDRALQSGLTQGSLVDEYA